MALCRADAAHCRSSSRPRRAPAASPLSRHATALPCPRRPHPAPPRLRSPPLPAASPPRPCPMAPPLGCLETSPCTTARRGAKLARITRPAPTAPSCAHISQSSAACCSTAALFPPRPPPPFGLSLTPFEACPILRLGPRRRWGLRPFRPASAPASTTRSRCQKPGRTIRRTRSSRGSPRMRLTMRGVGEKPERVRDPILPASTDLQRTWLDHVPTQVPIG